MQLSIQAFVFLEGKFMGEREKRSRKICKNIHAHKTKNLVLEVWHINYKLSSYELKDFLCCHVLCWYGLSENPLPPLIEH